MCITDTSIARQKRCLTNSLPAMENDPTGKSLTRQKLLQAESGKKKRKKSLGLHDSLPGWWFGTFGLFFHILGM
jgi:hypothetical protein